MNKKQQITPEQQRELIENNRAVIYRMPERYTALKEMLKPVKNDLLQIFKYALKHGLFRFYGRYTFILSNEKITYTVRKKTTTAVTNRHMNYLVALGLLRKETKESTRANKEFKKEHPELLPIGQYSIPKYTQERLELIEENAELMQENGITAGNISQHQLYFNGFRERALSQYKYNSRRKIPERETEKEILFEVIGNLVEEKGYTTKQELYADERFVEAGEIDRVFKIFKRDFLEEYNYKRPTNEEKARYKLTSNNWIITAKEKRKNEQNTIRL